MIIEFSKTGTRILNFFHFYLLLILYFSMNSTVKLQKGLLIHFKKQAQSSS